MAWRFPASEARPVLIQDEFLRRGLLQTSHITSTFPWWPATRLDEPDLRFWGIRCARAILIIETCFLHLCNLETSLLLPVVIFTMQTSTETTSVPSVSNWNTIEIQSVVIAFSMLQSMCLQIIKSNFLNECSLGQSFWSVILALWTAQWMWMNPNWTQFGNKLSDWARIFKTIQ